MFFPVQQSTERLSMKVVLSVGLVALFLLYGVGCDSEQRPQPQRDYLNPSLQENAVFSTEEKTAGGAPVSLPIAYGNDVYYFPYIQADFGNALSVFLRRHTNLEVSSIGGDVRRRFGNQDRRSKQVDVSHFDYGATVGYFVTFREKK